MSSSRIVLAFFANVALASTACGMFGSDDPAAPPPATAPSAEAPATAADPGPAKAPPVGGTAAQNELTDQFGVFVATNGDDAADGTHTKPFATIQAGIDHGKLAGKRVYVCAGIYEESLVIADSISIIGGLDCTAHEWRTSTGTSRVQSPTIPAAKATNITTPTRIEGLELIAPNATGAGASSIGLLADHAAALTIARTKITAGNGVKGDDGVEGAQLANSVTAGGSNIPGASACAGGDLSFCPIFSGPAGGAGGTNVCAGAPGHVGEAGGSGGSGGLFDVRSLFGGGFFQVHNGDAAFNNKLAPAGRTGAAGVDAADAPPPAPKGTLTSTGYIPADGQNGTDGAPGSGGLGGDGLPPDAANIYAATDWPVGTQVRGWGGGGGGAGGCPGLAGTAGKGGGASIAALLIESPVTFDGAQLIAGLGGDGGRGSLGSAPLPGGTRSNPEIPGQHAGLAPALGHDGGRGGAAGTSSNGSNGPSVAVAHVGAVPTLNGGSTMVHGTGGAAIVARAQVFLGLTKTVPATPAGVAADVLAF